jgi:hypothetical protein
LDGHEAFCVGLKKRIAAAYAESGNRLGWRLLASPSAVLDAAQIAFIGLNPGGSERPDDQPEFSMPHGSGYVLETWKTKAGPGASPLQRQVRTLFEKLGIAPERVLAGNLVPFRSPSWASLQNSQASLRFGEAIWSEIIQAAKPKLVIGMGAQTNQSLAHILGTRHQEIVPIGWGNLTASRSDFSSGTLVGLPHLSRFGVITRASSQDALKHLFGSHWQG